MDVVHTLQFARWQISFDAEATRRAYAAIPMGGPESCGCEHCQNFAAAREQAYPKQARDLFARLGIHHRREAEVYHLNQVRPGTHLYGGWFHFVGSIERGEEAKAPAGTPMLDLGSGFQMGSAQQAMVWRTLSPGCPLFSCSSTPKCPG